MVKRKNYSMYIEGAGQLANPSEIASRKIIRADFSAATPEKGAIPSSPGSITVGATRLRKNTRRKLYFRSMKELNDKFSKWAEQEEHKILAKVESGELNTTSKPMFYEADIMLYVRTAEEIRRKYQPATGDVLTFGSGDFGQLGHVYREDGNNDSMQPRCVMSMRNTGMISVACGGLHTIGLCDSGQVLCWGSNDDGSLGIVDLHTGYTPQKVSGFVPSSYELAQGLDTVYTWENITGEDITDPKIPLNSKYDDKICAVAAGDSHSLCLSSTGRVYFFGTYKDKDGRSWRDLPPKDDPREYVPPPPPPVEEKSGEEKGKEEPEKPKKAPAAPVGAQEWPLHVWQMGGEAVDIDCGGSFNAAIVEKTTESGESIKTCVTWGLGECGELARPVYAPIKNPHHVEVEGESRLAPYAIDKIRDEYLVPKPVHWKDSMLKRTVESIGCGGFHLLVTSRNLMTGVNSVHSAGLNNFGQLGLGDDGEDKNRTELTEVRTVYTLMPSSFLSYRHTHFSNIITNIFSSFINCITNRLNAFVEKILHKLLEVFTTLSLLSLMVTYIHLDVQTMVNLETRSRNRKLEIWQINLSLFTWSKISQIQTFLKFQQVVTKTLF